MGKMDFALASSVACSVEAPPVVYVIAVVTRRELAVSIRNWTETSVVCIAMAFTTFGADAQVLLDNGIGGSRIIVRGDALGTAPVDLYGVARRPSAVVPDTTTNGAPVQFDDNVRVPKAVVPQASIEAAPVEVGPDGTIDVRTDTYRVMGASYKDLWSSLQRATLGNGDSGVGDASITFQPRAIYVENDGSCAASEPAVDLTAVLTFPEWDTPSQDRRAVQAFRRTLDYLRVHEAQHILIARQFREEMVEAIAQLAPQPTCAAMRTLIAATAVRINVRQIAAQRAYDTKERKRSAELFSRSQ